MPTDFSDQGTDFAALYRDTSAPTDTSPQDDLFKQLSSAVQPAPAAAPAGGAPAAPAAPPVAAPAAAAAPAATPTGASTGNASAEAQGMLARLAPLGITSLDQLKGKTDVDLRKLTGDVLAYEQRQSSLNKNFYKNPDGSYDFSKGPDGLPTGLDATGKVVPPAGTAPPAAAPAPPTKPAAKPAAKPAPAAAPKAKPAPKKKPSAPTVKPKPKARPAPKKRPSAPKVVAKPLGKPGLKAQ